MKSSSMGEYIPALAGFEKGEKVIYLAATSDYLGFMMFFFASGKVAKVDFKAYFTKTNRKKLVKAYFEDDQLVDCDYLREDIDYLLKSSSGKIMIFSTKDVNLKQSKSTQGICVMKQKRGHKLVNARVYSPGSIRDERLYIAKRLPFSGKLPQSFDVSCEQMKLE